MVEEKYEFLERLHCLLEMINGHFVNQFPFPSNFPNPSLLVQGHKAEFHNWTGSENEGKQK